jgi:hypothetical protein
LIDFDNTLTPKLLRRMSRLVEYSADHGANAIALACSVYAPAVDTIKQLVDIPLVSSYGPVMADAVASGPRGGDNRLSARHHPRRRVLFAQDRGRA